MVRKLLSLAARAILAFALLTSCDQPQQAIIFGSIFTDFYVSGGTDFQVLVLSSSTTLDPTTAGSVESVLTVARYNSSYPGDIGDWYTTTNYLITDMPEGTYYVFAWIDLSGDGTFDSGDDLYGFYDGTWWSTSQPPDANVVVPAVGAADIDVYLYNLIPPAV
jgi:hypothetical protein